MTKNCPECGHLLRSDPKPRFCGECGYPIPQDASPVAPPTAPEPVPVKRLKPPVFDDWDEAVKPVSEEGFEGIRPSFPWMKAVIAIAIISFVYAAVAIVFPILVSYAEPTEHELLAARLTSPTIEGLRQVAGLSGTDFKEVRKHLGSEVPPRWRSWLSASTADALHGLGPEGFCNGIDSFSALNFWPPERDDLVPLCKELDAAKRALSEVEDRNRDAGREREKAVDALSDAQREVERAKAALAPFVTATVFVYGSLGGRHYEIAEVVNGWPSGDRFVLEVPAGTSLTRGQLFDTFRLAGTEAVTLQNGQHVTWTKWVLADADYISMLRLTLVNARQSAQRARDRLNAIGEPSLEDTAPVLARVELATRALTEAATSGQTNVAAVDAPPEPSAEGGEHEPSEAAAAVLTASFRQVEATNSSLIDELFGVICASAPVPAEGRNLRSCAKSKTELGAKGDGLSLQAVYAGRRKGDERATAVLGIDVDERGFNFSESVAFLRQDDRGVWAIVKYVESTKANDCAILSGSQTTHLFCVEHTIGGGGQDSGTYLLGAGGSVTPVFGWDSSPGGGLGFRSLELDEVMIDALPHAEGDEILLEFSYALFLPLETIADRWDVAENDSRTWRDEGKFLLAFRIKGEKAKRIAVNRDRVPSSVLAKYPDVPPLLLDAGPTEVLNAFDESSDLAYDVFRRRVAAFHNLQETARLRELGATLVEKFPEKSEQTLRDVAKGCFDADDQDCVDAVTSEAKSKGFDFASKITTWESERDGILQVPKTAHKVPKSWQEHGVPTSAALTKEEKLHGLELLALRASRDGKHAEAISWLVWLIEHAVNDEQRMTFLLALGKAFEKAEFPRRALSLYEAMERHSPADADVLNRLAWFVLTSDDPAIQDLARGTALAEKAAQYAPDDPSVLDTLAEARIRGDNKDAARALLRRCVALDPLRGYYATRLEGLE